MGTTPRKSTTIADALFTRAQQRVLGILYGNPERSYFAKEIIRAADIGSGAVQRELLRLVEAGLLSVESVGNQRHYRANRTAPVYDELHSLILKTTGLTDVIRAALASNAASIKFAFVYGSIAKGTDTAASDVDLMVVSDALSYAELFSSLSEAERRLGRPVNPTLYSEQEFEKRISGDKSFIKRVIAQPHIWIFGSDSDIPT